MANLKKSFVSGIDFAGINSPEQSDGSFYRVQILSDGRFRTAKNVGGSFDSWKDFLTNADLEIQSGCKLYAYYYSSTHEFRIRMVKDSDNEVYVAFNPNNTALRIGFKIDGVDTVKGISWENA